MQYGENRCDTYYDQVEADKFLGIDGQEELTVYISPVGKL